MNNKLNDLDGKGWIKNTRTWFEVNPRPRKKDEMKHPAKYPDELAEKFVNFFTKENQTVLDIFAGTGSTLRASEKLGRNAIGIELNAEFAEYANTTLENPTVVNADSTKYFTEIEDDSVDLLLTSPPYWNILNKSRGNSDSQHSDRKKKDLKLNYSDSKVDLGNVDNYEEFIKILTNTFKSYDSKIKQGGHMVIVVQNFMDKKLGYVQFSYDLINNFSDKFECLGEQIWVQSNKKLGIWGFKSKFIPNIHHQHCVIFRKKNA